MSKGGGLSYPQHMSKVEQAKEKQLRTQLDAIANKLNRNASDFQALDDELANELETWTSRYASKLETAHEQAHIDEEKCRQLMGDSPTDDDLTILEALDLYLGGAISIDEFEEKIRPAL